VVYLRRDQFLSEVCLAELITHLSDVKHQPKNEMGPAAETNRPSVRNHTGPRDIGVLHGFTAPGSPPAGNVAFESRTAVPIT
jgi:hypothetical protein